MSEAEQVWDGIVKFCSALFRYEHDVDELERKRLLTIPHCGDCRKWMIKSACKREANHIVSCNEHPCQDYNPNSRIPIYQEEYEAALKDFNAKWRKPTP